MGFLLMDNIVLYLIAKQKIGKKDSVCFPRHCDYNLRRMDLYQALLLILILVAFFYLALLVYVWGKMREFRLRLKGKLRGLNLLLYERSDVLRSLASLFKEKGLSFSAEDEEVMNALQAMDFTHPKEEEVRLAMDRVKTVTSRLGYLAQANRIIMSDPAYLELSELLEDLERNYRTLMSQYNADIVAYNYWIKVPTVSWFGYLLGYRKKLLIS